MNNGSDQGGDTSEVHDNVSKNLHVYILPCRIISPKKYLTLPPHNYLYIHIYDLLEHIFNSLLACLDRWIVVSCACVAMVVV